MRNFLLMLCAGVMLALPCADVLAQSRAGLNPGETEFINFRNKSGSTMLRGQPVEWDTVSVLMHTNSPIEADSATATIDSFRVLVPADSGKNPFTVEGVPFELLVESYGTASGDSIFVYGESVNPKLLPYTAVGVTTRADILLVDGGVVFSATSDTVWTRIDSIQTRISDADSVQIWIRPLFGMADADSAETISSFLGVVMDDSVTDNSLGRVVVKGPAFVALNGNTVNIGQYDYVGVGTSGFIKLGVAATAMDSVRFRMGAVARSLFNVTTSNDSGYIYLLGEVW